MNTESSWLGENTSAAGGMDRGDIGERSILLVFTSLAKRIPESK